MQAPWHGNVRELENVIHRTLLLCDGKNIDAASLRLSSRPASPPKAQTDQPTLLAAASPTLPPVASGADDAGLLLQAVQQLCNANVADVYQVVEDALFRYCHYSQSEAARLLGVSRNVVRARLIRLGEVGASRRLSAPRSSP